jgi:hypothetical protein
MSRLNVKTHPNYGHTHEGAPAARMNDEQALRRSVMSCLLWEDEFYEDGEEISARIVRLAKTLPPWTVSYMACQAREQGNLRHVPLLLLSVIAETGRGHREVADVVERVIQRADELTEFLAIHAKRNNVTLDKIKPTLSAQMKKGLARAFRKFDEYQLGKYDRAGGIRLRDVLFLCHAKPQNKAQERLWKRLVQNELEVPDTWEVALTRGADKKETFERLLREGRLGYLALLRNLRNMVQSDCDPDLVKSAILARRGGADRVLPFRYTAAARAAPQFESQLDAALQAAVGELPVLMGKTVVLVDVSRSMEWKLSDKSDLTRMDAAGTLASIVNADLRVFTFSDVVLEVPARRGMAGVDVIKNSQVHNGTHLFDAVHEINGLVKYDRLIVITDEQAEPGNYNIQGRLKTLPNPVGCGYIINVASAKHGVGYGKWVHVDGFSESVLRFIAMHEEKQS